MKIRQVKHSKYEITRRVIFDDLFTIQNSDSFGLVVSYSIMDLWVFFRKRAKGSHVNILEEKKTAMVKIAKKKCCSNIEGDR